MVWYIRPTDRNPERSSVSGMTTMFSDAEDSGNGEGVSFSVG